MEINITLFRTSQGILTSDYKYVKVENASYRKTDLNLYQINGKVNGKKSTTVSNDSVNKPNISKNKTIVIYNTHINSFDENYYYNNKEEHQKAYSKYNKELKEKNNIVLTLFFPWFCINSFAFNSYNNCLEIRNK